VRVRRIIGLLALAAEGRFTEAHDALLEAHGCAPSLELATRVRARRELEAVVRRSISAADVAAFGSPLAA
jgi:hypothetical protein